MYELAHAEKALKNLNSPNFSLYGIPTNEAEFFEKYKPVVGTEPDGTNIFATEPSQYVISFVQFAAELDSIETAYTRAEYQRQRAAEYPPITDYIDGVVKGDQAQIDAYIAACQAVKAKYPKAGE